MYLDVISKPYFELSKNVGRCYTCKTLSFVYYLVLKILNKSKKAAFQGAQSEKHMKRSFSDVGEFCVNFVKWQNILAFWYIIPSYSYDMKKNLKTLNIFKTQMWLEKTSMFGSTK